MKRILLSAAPLACPLACTTPAQTALHAVTIKVLDGRNGEVIKGAHLLVFAGRTVEQVEQHAQHFDLQTDQHGEAELTLSSDSIKFVQVWVDGKTLCQSRPNSVALSVEQVLSKGLLAPNGCGELRPHTEPGKLLVFARVSTFAEKMHQ